MDHVSFVGLLLLSCELITSLATQDFNYRHVEFQRDGLCVQEEHVRYKCLEHKPHIQTVIKCATMCFDDDKCLISSIDEMKSCYHHYACSIQYNTTCDNDGKESTISKQHTGYFKSCPHHGAWQEQTGVPRKCIGYCFGVRCEHFPSSCEHLADIGYNSGTYEVSLDLNQNFRVVIHNVICTVNVNSYFNQIQLISFTDNNSPLNMSWSDYKNGFVKPDIYFAGLISLHHLTSISNNWLQLQLIIKDKGLLLKDYFGFRVSNEDDNFSFSFNSVRNRSSDSRSVELIEEGHILGECFGPLQNTPFSTYDKDNDNSLSNCASLASSGGWFQDCNTQCNLFGIHPRFWTGTTSFQKLSMPGVDFSIMQDRQVEVVVWLIP